MIYYTVRASLAQYDIGDLDTQGRIAISRMSREIRSARSNEAADLDISSNAQITFVNVSGDTVTYSLSGTNLMRNYSHYRTMSVDSLCLWLRRGWNSDSHQYLSKIYQR